MRGGKVILVGAGCGDGDLITLRGAETLRNCDCVIYDALTDKSLLDPAPKKAEKICVGKRAGKHGETQENINRLLIEKASRGLTVVRLKGGDPFVFGRGGEEINALRNAGIPYGIVPGVSSAVAVPELAGIPVTHRGTARSFHVITAHTGDGLGANGLEKYAALEGTLVFLMGLSELENIARSLIKGGMRPDTPAAVISEGATLRQRTVRAPLSEIAEKVQKNGLKPPAVTVVGETAAYDLSPSEKPPLCGVTVGITGTEIFRKRLYERLRPLGAEVRTLLNLDVRENPPDGRAFSPEKYDWAVFTSANGAELFFSRLKKEGVDIRRTAGLKFAAIGTGTARPLISRGIFPDLIPKEFTSERLARELAGNMRENERALIYRAENGSSELTEILDSYRISYDEIKAYSLSAEKTSQSAEGCRYIVFASAAGARAYFEKGLGIPEGALPVCIGASAAGVLKDLGIKNFAQADEHSADGITEIIIREAGK